MHIVKRKNTVVMVIYITRVKYNIFRRRFKCMNDTDTIYLRRTNQVTYVKDNLSENSSWKLLQMVH